MTKYIQPTIAPIPIIDNLTTSETISALSANQGKILNDKLTNKADLINNKIPLSQLPESVSSGIIINNVSVICEVRCCYK